MTTPLPRYLPICVFLGLFGILGVVSIGRLWTSGVDESAACQPFVVACEFATVLTWIAFFQYYNMEAFEMSVVLPMLGQSLCGWVVLERATNASCLVGGTSSPLFVYVSILIPYSILYTGLIVSIALYSCVVVYGRSLSASAMVDRFPCDDDMI